MLQVPEAFGLAATTKQVACACAKGVVRLFASKSLQFKANLPYLSPQGVLKTRFTSARCCAAPTCLRSSWGLHAAQSVQDQHALVLGSGIHISGGSCLTMRLSCMLLQVQRPAVSLLTHAPARLAAAASRTVC